jgi:hypothetical protein
MNIREFYYNYFLNKGLRGVPQTETAVQKAFPELFNEIEIFIKEYYLNLKALYSEKMYLYFKNIQNYPICAHCQINKVKFKQFSYGYFEFCSVKCSSNSEKKKQLIEKTCLEKYGHRNIAHGKGVKEKIQEIYLEKYGGHPSQNKLIWEKKLQTFIERFGGHPFQNQSIKHKIEKKCLEKYGFKSAMKNKTIAQKAHETAKKAGLYLQME